MLMFGNEENVRNIVSAYCTRNKASRYFSEMLRYVKKHHQIGESNLYSLNFIDVACDVFVKEKKNV